MSSESNSPTNNPVNYEGSDIPTVDGTNDSPAVTAQPSTVGVKELVYPNAPQVEGEQDESKEKESEYDNTSQEQGGHTEESTANNEAVTNATLTTQNWSNVPNLSRKNVAYLVGAVAVALAGVFAFRRFR